MRYVVRIFTAKLYRFITNSDGNEGKGRNLLIGLYLLKKDALKAAKGCGSMGTNADVCEDMQPSQLIELDDGSIHALGIPVGKEFNLDETPATSCGYKAPRRHKH